MKKLKYKILSILLIIIMLVALVPLNKVYAAGTNNATVSYNLTAKQMPYVTYYPGEELAIQVETPLKQMEIPNDSYYLFFFVDESLNVEIDKSFIKIDGKKHAIDSLGVTWQANQVVEDGKTYARVGVDFETLFKEPPHQETGYGYQNIEAHFHYKDFKIQASKNLIETSYEDIQDALINNPAQYVLSNDDKSVIINGTATSQNVVWEVVSGSDTLLDEEKTTLINLPDGQYILEEINAGANLETVSGSTNQWLNSSQLEGDINKSYSFTVSEDTIDEWMYQSNFEGISNQLVFDFNSSEIRDNDPIVPETPETPDVPAVPETPIIPDAPSIPETPVIPEGPLDSITPIIPSNPIVPITPIVTQPIVRNDTTVRNDEVITIPDNETPLADAPIDTITDEEVPLAKWFDNGEWSLMNLICTLVTVALAIMMFITKNKKDEDQYSQHVLLGRVLTAIIAVGSVLLFIYTEDMRLAMTMFDKWTFAMAIILLAQIVVMLITRRTKKDKSNYETLNNV